MRRAFHLFFLPILVFLWSIFVQAAPVRAAVLDPSQKDAVIKIFVTSNEMDYYRPWQSKGIQSSSGSGVLIQGNRILTNAHVVSDQTFIQVKKDDDPKRYTAKLVAIGHDCDLALLEVGDPAFIKNVKPLDFGPLPKMQDNVAVIGYPEGGGKISVTEGVVSRIEVTNYAQSSRQLLSVQIDAAINPGNSGGPVVQNGKLVGIVMQIFQAGQNIGYMIPTPIINHFLKDLEDGTYKGFPLIGIDFNNTENGTLREYYGLTKLTGGVLVSHVLPFSPAVDVLKAGDVILKIEGVPIGEDGTFPFRDGERLLLTHLVTQKQIGEDIALEIIRNKKVKNVNVRLDPFTLLVPQEHYFEKPPYFIFGGLVFTVLSADLTQSWGNRWWEKAPLDFAYYVIGAGRLNAKKRKNIVVLLNVLPDDINVGYHGIGNMVLKKVNGVEFNSFQEFVANINRNKDTQDYTILETEHESLIILNNENIDETTQEILKRNSISYQYSGDVAGWLKSSQ